MEEKSGILKTFLAKSKTDISFRYVQNQIP